MLSSLLAKFKEEKKPESLEKTKVENVKSASAGVFLKTPETKQFVQEWVKKRDKQGRRMYTKRGVVSLLRALHGSALGTDEKILKAADKILMELRGMDGLQGFLAGWKAKSEGLMKGIKSALKKAA